MTAPRYRRLTDDEVTAQLAADRTADRATHAHDGRTFARTAAEQCADAFCVLSTDHGGPHDPDWSAEPSPEHLQRQARERDAEHERQQLDQRQDAAHDRARQLGQQDATATQAPLFGA